MKITIDRNRITPVLRLVPETFADIDALRELLVGTMIAPAMSTIVGGAGEVVLTDVEVVLPSPMKIAHEIGPMCPAVFVRVDGRTPNRPHLRLSPIHLSDSIELRAAITTFPWTGLITWIAEGVAPAEIAIICQRTGKFAVRSSGKS